MNLNMNMNMNMNLEFFNKLKEKIIKLFDNNKFLNDNLITLCLGEYFSDIVFIHNNILSINFILDYQEFFIHEQNLCNNICPYFYEKSTFGIRTKYEKNKFCIFHKNIHYCDFESFYHINIIFEQYFDMNLKNNINEIKNFIIKQL
jgi:hypothetical protein